MITKNQKQSLVKNLTAKYARKFNVAAVHVDRKKDEKRGKVKHKGNQNESV